MTMSPGSDYFDLADYAGVLKRRWLMIVAFVVIGLLLAGAYYFVAPRVYSSTVLIQVNALPTNANAVGGRTGGPVNMDNEAQILQSATVGAIAKASLGSKLTVANLLKEITVAVPPNTTFLQVSCDAGSPPDAQHCANAFGRAYLFNRRSSELALLTTSINQLYAQASALESSIEALKSRLKNTIPAGTAAHGIAELQLSAKNSRLTILQGKISAGIPLEASLTAKNDYVGQIATPATQIRKPVSPSKKLLLPSGLAGGAVLGLLFAFFWDWRRPRINQVRDIQRRVDLPIILNPADMKPGAQSAFAPPRSRTGQAFTELAQHIGTELGDGHHVLVVTGTSAGSADAVSTNLACALARSRGDTVLICADPNAVGVPRLLGTNDGRGFAEVLAGTAPLSEVIRRTADLPLLQVITPGLDAAGAVYDMQHDKVQRLMRELRREVRYVVIDLPPANADADTFSLAEFSDGAVIVLQTGIDRPADLNDLVERLSRMRTQLLAGVLLPAGTKVKRSRRQRAEYVPDEPPPPLRYQNPRPAPLPDPVPVAPPKAAAVAAPPKPVPAGASLAGPPAHPPVPRSTPARPAADDGSTSSAPVLRQVSTRRPSSQSNPANQNSQADLSSSASPADANGGSRHAAPNQQSAAIDATMPDLTGSANFVSGWKPRSVSETWPLPRTALTEEGEEPDSSNPLNGD
jgi:Mrp family chromosome partitioning ATPase/capsular polysaccharide biosynthesis protein